MAKAQDSNDQAPPAMALTFEQLKELMAAAAPAPTAPISAADLAAAVAAGVDKWKPHEIRRPEQKSVYNPDGERDHPKPKLQFHVYEGSYPLGDPSDNRTLTKAEVEALNSLRPGFYQVEMFDQSIAVVEIRAQLNAAQEIERLWVIFPEGKDKNGYGSWPRIASYCTPARRVRNPILDSRAIA
jgi:hypothetical protein